MLVVLSILCLAVSAQKRVALVIGNGKYSPVTGYKPFGNLPTPVNDAMGMKNILKAMHYDVTCDTNVNRNRTLELVREFKSKASGADIALLYFSGHGCVIRGEEYIVPSGDISHDMLSSYCVSFEEIRKMLEGCRARVRVAFIDACRSDPASKAPMSVGKKSPELGGFACFYASEKGKPANVGSGNYSVFTKRLIEHIHKHDNLRNVWGAVVDAVVSDDAGQKPSCTSAPNTDIAKIYLNPDKVIIENPYLIVQGLQEVVFRLSPSNVVLSLDDETYSDGQAKILKLGKSYKYQAIAPGYETKEGSIVITSFDDKDYSINLTKLEPATLSVRSNVSDASVYLDGKYVGETPIDNKETLSGVHTIKVKKSGYYSESKTLRLSAGDNYERFVLTKDAPWAWDWDGYEYPKGNVSYHFSPRYQLGLSYDHIFENHFSIGGMFSTSFGAYRGVNFLTKTSYSYSETDLDGNVAIYSGDLEYSSFVDPYNEAKHCDSNVLLLLQGGYLPCNLVMINLGLGAAMHRDKYYMENTYSIMQKDDVVEYKPVGFPHWYKQNTKWSPAVRLGAKFFIPLDEDQENCITIGGGYTYLPTTHKYSSWDASVGFSWQF